MEKEKNKTIIITKELHSYLKKTNKQIRHNHIFKNTQNLIKTLVKKKETKITIYDITKTDPLKQKIEIKNHINKTGRNPLIKNQKKLKIDFLDITKIYKNKDKKAIVTTSLGKRYSYKKHKHKNPSTEIANIAIICAALGYKETEAFLINTNHQD